MLHIEKGSAPRELEHAVSEMMATPDTVPNYGLLDGAAKRAVLRSLLDEQGYLCAYCMCRVESSNATIEHIVPRHSASCPEGSERSLDYGNMLAVCNGRGGETCDKHRGNRSMKVNPLILEHVKTISYARNGEIGSSDAEIDRDLNETLNLNSRRAYLTVNRKAAIRRVDQWIEQTVKKEKCEKRPKAKAHLCEKKIRSLVGLPGKKPEYLGAMLFELERMKRKFEKQARG